ncbi:MAG: peptidase C15 [Chroococcales cyanobacterium]
MKKHILLTSFSTWLPHHTTNSSDDLLLELQKQDFPHASLHYLRQLPVDIAQANQKAIAKLEEIQPDFILCCGMAEKRDKITLESTATCDEISLKTPIDIENLLPDLTFTEISHDAGKFVCEGLYFKILNRLKESQSKTQCLFLHIPLFTPENQFLILNDVLLILKKLCQDLGTSDTINQIPLNPP